MTTDIDSTLASHIDAAIRPCFFDGLQILGILLSEEAAQRMVSECGAAPETELQGYLHPILGTTIPVIVRHELRPGAFLVVAHP